MDNSAETINVVTNFIGKTINIDAASFENCALNYPFFVYPGYPFSGYFDIESYKINLIKLNKKICELKTNITETHSKILFHLTLGASMEEYFNLSCTVEREYGWQCQQLCPEHLLHHAKLGAKIVHFIVSPTKSFEPVQFIEPLFVSQLNELWQIEILDNVVTIKSIEYDIVVYLFYTMMPTNDSRNIEIVKKLKNITYACPIENIKQTSHDREFTLKFYDNLKLLFDSVTAHTGTVTCFSFAVFNEPDKRSKFKNYVMFNELKTHINWTSPNMLLGEWTFIESCYVINIHNNLTDNLACNNSARVISYVKPLVSTYLDYSLMRINVEGCIYFQNAYEYSMSINKQNKKKKCESNDNEV